LQNDNSLNINLELANKNIVNGYQVVNDTPNIGYSSNIPGWDSIKS
jgi:hypothetical protein